MQSTAVRLGNVHGGVSEASLEVIQQHDISALFLHAVAVQLSTHLSRWLERALLYCAPSSDALK